MLWNSHFDHLLQIFEGQFDAIDKGYLYRKSLKGPAIFVTPEERQNFVDTYLRHLKSLMWLLVCCVIPLSCVMVAYVVATNSQPNDTLLYIGLSLLCAAFVVGSMRAWGAPARMLQHRVPTAGKRSRAEVRQAYSAKTSWSYLAGTGALLIAAIARQASKHDLTVGWNRLWLIGGFLGLGGLAYRGYQKWRFERNS